MKSKRDVKRRLYPDFVTRRSTGESSSKLGPCEVCGEHCSDVWIERTMGQDVDPDDGPFVYHKKYSFGHSHCLVLRHELENQ